MWDRGWRGLVARKSSPVHIMCTSVCLILCLTHHLDPHITLFSSFVGISPVEALFVLIHALSSDTRVIYVSTVSLFDNFDRHLQWSLENFINTIGYEQLESLHENLSQVSYTLEDDEFVKLVDIVFNRAAKNKEESGDSDDELSLSMSDDICNPIAAHYGWSEVDDRRETLIFHHLMSKKAPTARSSLDGDGGN